MDENQSVSQHVNGFNFAMQDEISLHKICYVYEAYY